MHVVLGRERTRSTNQVGLAVSGTQQEGKKKHDGAAASVLAGLVKNKLRSDEGENVKKWKKNKLNKKQLLYSFQPRQNLYQNN
jgi:hypothetical protein